MRKIFSFYLLCLLTVSSWAQENYQKKEFVSSFGDSLSYRLLRPENEQAGSKYPLVLFLHGAGERGSDNEKQLTHGAQMFLNPVNREKYPAFVLTQSVSLIWHSVSALSSKYQIVEFLLCSI